MMKSRLNVLRGSPLSVMIALAIVVQFFLSPVAVASLIGDYNLIVTHNLRSSSEVEGRTLVGGDINGISGSSSNYGIHLDAGDYSGVDTLIVGGDINTTINLNAGHARIGGSVQGINANNGSTWQQGDSTVAAEVAAATTAISSLSQHLYTFGGDSVSLPGSQPSGVNFNASPGSNGIAFFEIPNGNNLFNNDKVQQMSLSLGSADFVVMNVGGTSINWNHGNMVGDFVTEQGRSRVLWNFYEATFLDMKSRGFNGSLLAPLSFLRVEGVVEGSVFVKSFRQMGEVHLPLFATDTFPEIPDPPGPAVPEPASFMVGLMALLMAAAFPARNRRARC